MMLEVKPSKWLHQSTHLLTCQFHSAGTHNEVVNSNLGCRTGYPDRCFMVYLGPTIQTAEGYPQVAHGLLSPFITILSPNLVLHKFCICPIK